MNQAYHPDIPISVFRAMDGNDAMKLVLPAAAFAVGVPRCKRLLGRRWRRANGSMLMLPVAVSEVSLLLYFWPRWVPFHRHNSAVFGDGASIYRFIKTLS